MTYMKNLGITAILGAFAVGAVACGDDDDPEPSGTGGTMATTPTTTTANGGNGAGGMTAGDTIADVAAAEDDLTILLAAATAAGLDTDLANPDVNLTVFAPTDGAFVQALTDLGVTQDALLGNVPLLTAILQYHILASEVFASAITEPSAQSSANGFAIFVAPDAGTVDINGGSVMLTNGGATVTEADLDASNGVIHKVDRVLLPPDLVSLARYATDSGVAGFADLQQALVDAGLAGNFSVDLLTADLANIPQSTLFAPTDDVFPDGVTDPAILGPILSYHVVDGAAVGSDAIDFPAAPTMRTVEYNEDGAMRVVPLSLLFDTSGSDVVINGGSAATGPFDGTTPATIDESPAGAEVVVADLRAVNGIAHVVNNVLMPLNVAEVAARGGFTELVNAVGGASDISGGGPVLEALGESSGITVFAPTDMAFMGASLGTPTADQLRDVLLLHVVPGPLPVLSGNLPGNTTDAVGTLLTGGELNFDAAAMPPTVTVAGTTNALLPAGIAVVDIGAENGVVHVIDQVLTN
ncbi:MAG: fasciclin domain-containing protein [Myxococcota bacterium]